MTNAPEIELSVILPAYNESGSLRSAIERYARCLPHCCNRFEIIVVNDGSTDDTLAIAHQAARDFPEVRVLDNPKNLGQVASLLRGFAESRGRVVTHNGIDLPLEPEETAALLEGIRQGADVVVVERRNRQAYGIVRKVISWCNILVVQTLFRSPFTDHNFTQAYRREVLDAVAVETAGVSTVTTELILKARALGFRMHSLQRPYRPRETGHSSITVRKILRTVAELLRLWAVLRRWQKRMTSASPLPVRKSWQPADGNVTELT
jgi:dolichol-phosphate mannosyltransferase